jgi:outer membrane protein assembly factor BamB
MRRAASVFWLILGLMVITEGRQASTDVTQWRGPNRDGVVTSFTAPATWPEQLTQRWKVEVGSGYATPIVVGNRVYTFTRQGEDEVMSAIDAASGKVVWRTAYPAPFEMNSAAKPHGPGPKSTPVYSNGRLFAIGMTGAVTAYDAATGKQVWQKPAQSPVPMYTSHAFSPIIEGGVVIFHVGGHDKGALTAFDVNTGNVRWSWSGDGPGYGSPIIADFGGVRQLVTITQGKLIGIDPSNGTLLWEQPYVSSNFTNSITPVRYGDIVLAWGSSNTAPMMAVRVARQNNKWMVQAAWENADVPGRMSNAVLDGDVLYGLTSRNMGQYYALDVKTGKTLWTSEGRQAAQVALARVGSTLIGLEGDGELLVFRASRTGFEPIRRYRVAAEEMFSTWAQPALSGNRIFVKDASTVALWTVN